MFGLTIIKEKDLDLLIDNRIKLEHEISRLNSKIEELKKGTITFAGIRLEMQKMSQKGFKNLILHLNPSEETELTYILEANTRVSFLKEELKRSFGVEIIIEPTINRWFINGK